MKICLTCTNPVESRAAHVTNYCQACRDIWTNYMQKRRQGAHRKVCSAIVRGELKPIKELSCVDCGAQATIYEHRDYTKPLDVEPVCHKCNSARGPGLPYPSRESILLAQ